MNGDERVATHENGMSGEKCGLLIFRWQDVSVAAAGTDQFYQFFGFAQFWLSGIPVEDFYVLLPSVCLDNEHGGTPSYLELFGEFLADGV